MTRSLMTGITGLRTHQQKLDVVANNLANMNTIGYKAQSTTFSDLMYDTIRTGSTSEASGGINPQSIGTGVQVAQITRKFTQGALQSTGQILDFAIQGEGFFTLDSQAGETVFTRAGSFALDGQGRLVDPATGFLVQRFGDVGEGTNGGFAFQVPGDNSIRIPIGSAIPGEPTQNLELFGNLPASSVPPTEEILSSFEPFETASGPANLTTSISDLTINQNAYGPGDQIEINGTNPDGTPFTGSIPADGATLGDIVTELNNLLTGATAQLQPDGTLSITADETGEAFLSLLLSDAAGNVGSTSFGSNSMVVEAEGSDGDTYELSMEIYDLRGASHRVTFDFLKTSPDSWDVTADISPDSGIMLDDSVFNLTFNEDGTYSLAGSNGIGDANIEIKLNSLATPQTIAIDFGQLSHLATDYSLSQNQDGYPPGNLVSVAVSSDGEISGLASNGKILPLAQLAMASFTNEGALDPIGNNYFQQSLNSGSASIGEGISGGRGQIIGAQLESSNVDIAQEFTQLIVAQRGFSANARTITVADEMLEELTNIVR